MQAESSNEDLRQRLNDSSAAVEKLGRDLQHKNDELDLLAAQIEVLLSIWQVFFVDFVCYVQHGDMDA